MPQTCRTCRRELQAEDARFCPFCGSAFEFDELVSCESDDELSATAVIPSRALRAALAREREIARDWPDEWVAPRPSRARWMVPVFGVLAVLLVTLALARSGGKRSPETGGRAAAGAGEGAAQLVSERATSALDDAPAVADERKRARRPSRSKAIRRAKQRSNESRAQAESRVEPVRAESASAAVANNATSDDDAGDDDPAEDGNDADVMSSDEAEHIEADNPADVTEEATEDAAEDADEDADADADAEISSSQPDDATRAEFFVKLGRAQLERGEHTAASASYARALALDPNNSAAKRGLEASRQGTSGAIP